jgi:hypothetical protein
MTGSVAGRHDARQYFGPLVLDSKQMNPGLDTILSLTFGKTGNEGTYLGNGWSGDEPDRRWMIGQGSELWLEHPGSGHDLILELDVGVLSVPSRAAGQRLVIGVRNHGIAQIAVARGGLLGFHIPAALVEAPGPVRIVFIHPDFARPMDLNGGTDDRQLSFTIRSLRLHRVLPRPAAAGGAPLPPDQMIMRFESLGDNCEFGLVQRNLGAEPLGMLRFTFIELRDLIQGLRTRFRTLGDPGTMDISVSDKDREYVVRDTAFNMTFHTWQYEHQLTIETARRQHNTRLNFLRRKFIEDVENAEKIFVIKRVHPLRPEEVLPLYAALNELGCNWLLWVTLADEKHPVGSVEVLLPGLLRGYVDRFAPNENAPDLSLAAWTSVCEAAWRAVGNQ